MGYTGVVCVACNRLIAETPREGERLETLKRLGHHFIPVFICVILGTAVVSIVWDNVVITWAENTLVVMTAILAVLHITAHVGLCEKCLNIPLNPSGAAESKDRWLRLFHWEMDGPLYAPLSIPIAGLIVTLAVQQAISPQAGDIVWLVAYAIPTSGSFYATWVHHRLEPWCKYCRRGRGKDEEEWEPTPDPSISR